jgi:predicted nucleotide-binding protein
VAKTKAVPKRPRLFIGSTSEKLNVAQAAQQELEYDVEARIWNQGLFRAGEATLQGLVRTAPTFDFALLILEADDVVVSRTKRSPAPRDNLLFELGLMMGVIGPDRTYFLYDRTLRPKLPSDLAGITPLEYSPPGDGNYRAAIGPACHAIRQRVAELGFR